MVFKKSGSGKGDKMGEKGMEKYCPPGKKSGAAPMFSKKQKPFTKKSKGITKNTKL